MRTLLFGILLLSVNLIFSQEIGVNRIENEESQLFSAYSIVPVVKSIDNLKAVGEIPLVQGISNGALTYTVPIEVYPGKNGLTPKISINYNSMMKSSCMEIGWFLGGLSSIDLVNNNLYYDSSTSPSELSFYGSSYVLDGTRLIRVTGETYDFQSETGLINVKAILDVSNKIKYFKVFHPNGIIAIYGFEANNTHQVIYPLTKMEDIFGNTIEFIYHTRTNVYDISEIKYGGNNNSAHFASIKFSYDNKRSREDQYSFGLTLSSDKRVSKIETFFNNTLQKTYDITYQSFDSPLVSKIDCSSNGESLNPLQFYYGNNINDGFEVKNFTTKLGVTGNITDFRVDKGKFSYNSSNDGVVVYRNLSPYVRVNDVCYTNKLDIGAIDNMPIITIPNIDKAATEGSLSYGDAGSLGVMVADVDGDGIDELIQMNSDRNATNYYEKVTYTSYSVAGSTLTQKYKNTISYNEYAEHNANHSGTAPNGVPCKGLKAYCPIMRTHISGNFLGDNKTYILSVSSNKTHLGTDRNSKFTLFSPTIGTVKYSQNIGGFDYLEDYLVAIDHDGDGKTDICHINPLTRRMNIYTFEVSESTIVLKTLVSNYDLTQGYAYRYSGYLFTDLNNDGKIDIVALPEKKIYSGNLPFIVYFSKGKGAFERKRLDASIGDGAVMGREDFSGTQVSFQDVNRDGRVDLVICRQNKTVSVHLGKITGYFDLDKSYRDVILSKDVKLVPVNIQQPNYTSCLLAIENNNIFTLNAKFDGSKNALLNKSISSLGVVREHIYGNISQPQDDIYTIGTQEGDSYDNLQGNLSLIKQNVIKYNDNVISSNSYKYIKGVLDKRGKGFLGYEKIISTDNIRNQTTTQIFDPKKFGILKSVDSPTMASTYNYNIRVESNKIAQVTLFNKVEKEKLKNISKTTAYIYDTYGLPLVEAVDYGGSLKTTTYNQYNNYNTVTSYRLGVLKETSIKEERGMDYVTTRTVYSDFNSQYLPKSKIEYYKYRTDPEMQVSQESYTYDSQNNMIQRSIKPYSSTISQIDNYTYDNLGRITGEIDPLGLKVSYAYNNVTGLLEKNTNHKGQNTTYNYDTWGRNIKTTYPDGTIDSIEMLWVPNINSDVITDTNSDSDIHELNLSTARVKGGVITACERISLKSGFSYNSIIDGSLMLKIDPARHSDSLPLYPTTYADSPPQYTNGSAATYLVTTTKTGAPMAQIYYDAFGREIRSGRVSFDGRYLYTDRQYDNRGRLSKVSQPFKGNSATKWNAYGYDDYDRMVSLTNEVSGKRDTYTYPLNTTKIISLVDGVSVTRNYDDGGMLVSVVDPGGTIIYTYRADKQIVSILSPVGVETKVTYDKYGRQETIDDPSAGIKTYVYDNEGNIKEEKDARGSSYVTSMTYDSYNRLKTKTADGIITTINYAKGTDGKENGLIQSVSENNGISTAYTYDTYDRILSEKRIVTDGKSLEKTYSYNEGNISAITYKSNLGNINSENYLYSYGSLNEIKLGSTSIWSLVSENDLGMPTEVKTGNLTRSYGYDTSGLVTSRIVKITSGTVIQNLGYNFDPNTMNLKWRKDNTRSALPQENFTYDGLNRLRTSVGKVPFTMTYDNSTGNITDNSIVGGFTYGQKDASNKTKLPYSITEVTPYSNDFSLEKQTIVYNTMMRPSSVTEDLENSDNFMFTAFAYDGDGDRTKMETKKGKDKATQLTRYYIGGQYEQDSGVTGDKEKLYLGGDAYSAPAVYVKENGNWQIKYILRDYLGSITHLTDASGKVLEEFSYDPWGRMRNPNDHTLYAAGKEPTPSLGRGYTGHEHLGMHGLINMNARLYDPLVGRFLSPDPYVQSPDFSQSFNRYNYALNNPLKYTDPNGEFIVPFLAGLAFGYLANGYNTGDWGWSSVGSGVFVGSGMGATYAMSGGGNPWAYSAQSFSMMIDPLNIEMGDFTLSLSPYSMLTGGVANQAGNGFALGAGVSLGYDDGKASFYTGGIGAFRNGLIEGKFSIGGGYNGYGLYLNYYAGKDAQFTGTASVKRGNFSLRWENDAIAGMIPLIGKYIGGDKYRSNAIELGLGGYFVGTNVYTDKSIERGLPGLNRSKLVGTQIPNLLRGDEVHSYPNAYTRSSPLYIGKKTRNNITRIGVNSPLFGDLFQNGFHFLMGSPYFGRGNFGVSPFYQTGNYSPSIMY